MVKYTFGSDGLYEGVVLKWGNKGVIQNVLFRYDWDSFGDWVAYNSGKEVLTFPLWHHFDNKSKKSLGELTESEFWKLVEKLHFLPGKSELRQCYELLRQEYLALQETGYTTGIKSLDEL